MGFLDVFKGKQYKEEAENLSRILEEMRAQFTPEMNDAALLVEKIANLKKEQERKEQQLLQLDNTISEKNLEIRRLQNIVNAKESAIVCLDEEILVQEFGLYRPTFEFSTSTMYKDELIKIREREKRLIKDNKAVTGLSNWTVDGSISKGKKMIADIQKLLLRAFNNECDELISKVKYTNFNAFSDKISKAAGTISKLGATLGISVKPEYLDCKMCELRIAFEYQQKKQEEKEALKEARAEMREAAKLQKELEAQRKKIEKEQTHYQAAYEKLMQQLKANPDDPDLAQKRNEIENQLTEINKAMKDIDYREANQKAGYVYIISNIGAFGENVYKIGMTRRLDPQERVDELGDASVPFNFDVHAMIFSDNAPALEAALHKAFENRKINMVNTRREFFNVSLDEIKAVIKDNFDKTVEFIDVPDAEQYRISQKMKSNGQN